MLGQFVQGRVAVFIDAENVFYAQRTLGWHISYERLMVYLKKECGNETKCFVYKGINATNYAERRFLRMLKKNGYKVHTKAVKKIRTADGRFSWKNNLDIELAFGIYDLAPEYDTAVLLSGDSDFALPIKRIKSQGKRIIVISTRKRISKELLRLGKFVDLKKLKDEIAQKFIAPPEGGARVPSR